MDLQLILHSLPRLIGYVDWPQVRQGALLTIELVALSLVLGLCLAVPMALMRVSRRRLLWMPVYAYIFFFRGTPLLVQIFLIYYGLGQFAALKETFLWPVLREAYWCAILAFTLNTAAYTAEILRGSIQAVPHGEVEAGRALGMSTGLLYRRIILPRALRLVLPAYSNEVILMLQASSLASVVTLADLTGVARVIVARSFAPYEIFITIGVIYLAMTYVIAWAFRRVEWRLSGHLRERPAEVAAGVPAETGALGVRQAPGTTVSLPPLPELSGR